METEYSSGGCGIGGDGEKNKRRQHCTYCKNHGENSRKTNHKCRYENCDCLLCKLTRLSRLIMRNQQRLWRHLKDTRRREDAADGSSGSDSSANVPGVPSNTKQQKCDMCRNHGVIKEKRAHKNACPYQDCRCALCDLTMKRRKIMRHQQRVKRSQVTSKQRNEAYDYVTQTTEELTQLSNSLQNTSLSIPSTSTTPSTPPRTSTPTLTPATPHTVTPIVPSSSLISPPSPLSPSPLYSLPPTSTTTTSSFKDVQPMETLEKGEYVPTLPRSLVVPEPRRWSSLDPFIHYDTDPPTMDVGGYQPLGGAWRSLKREREDLAGCTPTLFGDTNILRNLDFMRGSSLLNRDNYVRGLDLHAYDSMASVDIGAYRDPTLQTPPPLLPSTAPSKKTRFTVTSEDLRMRYRRGFWGGSQAEVGFLPREDLPHAYRRQASGENTEARMRSPPALIPLTQQQPVRPQPVSPLRPLALPPGIEWDPVSLPCLAYSLLHTRTYARTLPPPHFGLSQVTPLLHPSVP